jgi:diguanylate cyclase (GGDEF)-like protein/PAS domain S-box-containing protein
LADPTLHPLLERQLRRSGVDLSAEHCSPQSLRDLIVRINSSYAEHDQERQLLERAQALASDEMGALYAEVIADRDLLDQRVRERTLALERSEGRLASLLSLSADWVWEADPELRYTYVSESIETSAGIAVAELIGQRCLGGEVFEAPGETALGCDFVAEGRRVFRDFISSYARADGAKRYIRISGEPVFDAEGRFTGYRGIGSDVTLVTEAERKIYRLARFDSLTGLPNRNMFLRELERAISRARRHKVPFALCFIDLDRFKIINDTLGHQAGDELLLHKARQLRAAVRDNDLIARLGGDEFVVLLEGSTDPGALSAVAGKLLDVLAQPTTIQDCSFLVTGSIGIAAYPVDGEDGATLLKHADAAMYQAKAKGKNNVQFYTASFAETAAHQFEIESALRLALVRDELLLHFQPKLDVASQRMVGMEALVRWMHPTRGLVPPMDFIPLAEERGLIVPVGRWVIQAACRQIRAWRDQGLSVPPVGFNVSARQLASDTLIEDVMAAMKLYGVVGTDLEVELTESVLMTDPERASQVLAQLQAMGLRISIDDFGTGYSSLSYLKRFPAQTVKIDRSFIRGLATDRNDRAITQAVIAMAHSLGLTVIAEGVETPEQLSILGEMGCDEVQGYLLGRPMPQADLAQRLSAQTGAPTGAPLTVG